MLTISEIASDSLASLGNPPNHWLSVRDVARIIRRRLAYCLTTLAQSDQSPTMSKYEFTANGREQSLAFLGEGSPAWIEKRTWTGTGIVNDDYAYIPTVSLDTLEDYRNEGREAAAFYKDGQTNLLKVRFTHDTTEWGGEAGAYRIWFDTDVTLGRALSDPSGLPPNFNYMISDGVIVDSVGLLMGNVSGLEDGVSDLQIQAWREMQRSASARLEQWEQAFKEYRNRSRGQARGRNRRPVLRNVYRGY